MKLLPSTLAVLLIGVATITTVNAQTFTNGLFSTDSVLTLAGTTGDEVYGVDFGSSTASLTTSNGYVFEADPRDGGTLPVTYGTGNGSNGGFFAPTTTGDANFDAVLNSVQLGGNNSTLVLGGLTAGTAYNLLVLDADQRTGFAAGSVHTVGITDNGVTSAAQTFLSAGTGGSNLLAPNVGGYVLESFTATGTSETLTIDQANGGQLNGILLETAAVPEPSSISMVGMAMALMVVVLRRRGALQS
jgi:hypothetical protein